MITKARTSTYQSLPDSEQITDPARVVRLLERLAKQHTLLTVTIPGHQEHYTSSIVGIDRPFVLLDELLPPSGHQVLIAERTLQVNGKLDGIDIQFMATLERVDNSNNVVTYHLNLPGQFDYRQRRLDHRVHIPMAQTLRVITDSSDGTVIEGVLHDLSHGGAGIIFPDGTPEVGSGQLHECAIELPDDVCLYCSLELLHSKHIQPGDRLLVGALFSELSQAQTRIVGQCINRLERELIRKRAAD